MFKFQYNYSDIDVKADFKDKVNILFDDSGSGKTFLFEIIKHYCKENNIIYAAFDYKTSMTETQMIESCKGAELLILDNADLYITCELLNKFKSICDCILISIKEITEIDLDNSGFYTVRYENNSMEVLYHG